MATKPSRQLKERPICLHDVDPALQDGVGFLVTSANDIGHFFHCIPNVNVHYFSTDSLAPSAMLDPVGSPRYEDLRRIINQTGYVVVYKIGAETG